MFVHKIAMGIGYGLNMFTMLKTVSSPLPPPKDILLIYL